jgi:hypothetical protein
MNARVPTRRLALLSLLSLAACGGAPPPEASTRAGSAADELAAALRAMGSGVDPGEAERMAAIAFSYPLELARDWGAVDGPLAHNTQVNLGLKPRGLCYHWANSTYARMWEEEFRTLDLHLGIANADNPFRLEHSALIVSARGAPMEAGIVLDPWRLGRGRLHWVGVAGDDRYAWRPRDAVLAEQGAVPSSRMVLMRE